MILLTSVLNWKTVCVILGLAVLIYGICLGPKGKASDTKNYDAKEKKPLDHYFRAAEGGNDYVYKGSGRYRNSNGEVKKDK